MGRDLRIPPLFCAVHLCCGGFIGWDTSRWAASPERRGDKVMETEIVILGGDLRTAYLSGRLARDGHKVTLLFWKGAGELCPGVRLGAPPEEALPRASAVVLPTPASSGEGALNAPYWPEKVPLEPLAALIPRGIPVMGGSLGSMGPGAKLKLEEKNIPVYDLLDREELAVINAACTAEGALAEAVGGSPRALLESRCVVIGYGRIGRVLSRYLSALGARVTVTARRPEHFAWIRTEGSRPWATSRLREVLPEADFVFNTVPKRLLEGAVLDGIRPDTLVIDLASSPGGIAPEEAKRRGLQVIWARGLPGKVAPRMAGESIAEAVEDILLERGLIP